MPKTLLQLNGEGHLDDFEDDIEKIRAGVVKRERAETVSSVVEQKRKT